MANETDSRALGAALSAPAFVTRGHGVAMHAADRHVERWAPEAGANRVRSMRSLGFVDRLVAPWIETAQRSASLRLFNQYASTGMGERAGGAVSWVFPRPWYQDELDWMAAARSAGSEASTSARPAPNLLTTRGTYVPPASSASSSSGSSGASGGSAPIAAPPVAMPSALYEYIAPSLSLAANRPAAIPGVGYGGERLPRGEAYSSLVPLAAVQAAELMTRAIAPLVAPRGVAAGLPGAGAPGTPAGPAGPTMMPTMTPGLRSVLTSILARAAASHEAPTTRIAGMAPALVTPPAPRPDAPIAPELAAASSPGSASAIQVAEVYAAQQLRVAELQRVAQQSAQREIAARAEATARAAAAGAALTAPGAQAGEAAQARAAAQAREAAVARAMAQAGEAAAARQAAQAVQSNEAAAVQTREAAAVRAAQAGEAARARAAEGDATAQAGEAAARSAAQAVQAAQTAELRAAAERAEAELRERVAAGRPGASSPSASIPSIPSASIPAASSQAPAPSAAEIERARAALIQGGAAGRAAEIQRQADAARAEAAAERARIEERVAQRLAERGSAQRLHEQARAEAAAHARAAGMPAQPGARSGEASGEAFAAAPSAAPTAPAEVTAAIAGLPPELAALLGSVVAQRPDRAMQAISELNQTLRTVELLARSSAAGAAFQVTRGPRLVMPAGLGGLVSAVDRAQSISERPAMLGGGYRPLAPLGQFVAPGAAGADSPEALAAGGAPGMAPSFAAARALRAPALPWLAADPRASSIAPSNALGATAAAAPAALSHVAWADRWLARFAGATPQSLDMITAAGAAAPSARMQALASAAPGAVFVTPDFLRGDLAADSAVAGGAAAGGAVAGGAAAGRAGAAAFAPGAGAAPDAAAAFAALPAGAAAAAAPSAAQAAAAAQLAGMQRIAQPADVRRFADESETPDDVFAAISAAASRGRGAAPRLTAAQAAAQAAVAAQSAAAAQAAAASQAADRPMLADLVAHAAPSAPGAGLSAQLASSPFASALRHVLTLPSAPSFDVRALFGADLGATYLAGLIGTGSRELEIGAQSAPIWASWAEAPLSLPLADRAGRADRADRIDRLVPGFDAAYVRPELPRDAAELGIAGAEAVGAAPSLDARSAAQVAAAMAAAQQAGAPGAPADASRLAGAPAGAQALAGTATGGDDIAAAAAAAVAGTAALVDRMTTLRTALLSWEVAASTAPGAQAGALQLAPAAFATAPSLVSSTSASYRDVAAASAGAARRMVEAMSLPMLGEAAPEQPVAWSGPGMLAERAQSWSVAQERSASDLSLDFVTPELVLAARVYGLGPVEAAQAARLAIAGAGSLGAMASTVDRTFVDAMAIGRDARLEVEIARQQRGDTAGAPGARAARGGLASMPGVAQALTSLATPAFAPPTTAATSVAGGAGAGIPAELAAALAVDEARTARAAITTAFPTADGGIAAALAPGRATAAPGMAGFAVPPSTGTAFGVDRRAPRGAFLWPAATVAALGMNAAAPDGQLSMSVAALELLAAQVVAEIGTFTALSDAHAQTLGVDESATGLAGASRTAAAAAAAASGAAAAGAAASADPQLAAVLAAASPAQLAAALSDPRTATGALAAASPAQLAAALFAVRSGDRAGATAPGAATVPGAPGGEPGEAEVLGAAAALIPASRRARFEALYLSLGQSSAGLHWSPAARAARALALAGRGEDRQVSARERAASAWDVLPVVYGGDLGEAAAASAAAAAANADAMSTTTPAMSASAAIAQAMSTHVSPSWLGGPRGMISGGPGGPGGAAARGTAARGSRGAGRFAGVGAGSRDLVTGDVGDAGDGMVQLAGSGRSGLASRAGEALGSYITSAAPPSAPRDRASDLSSAGAVMRPPSAAPEYVQTGRSGGRYGGGEVEIPPWFEAAARKMLADRSDNADGISLAELTLVTAAPASHIAASTRAAPSAVPAAPAAASAAQQNSTAPQIDVEKLANEVYRNILVLMDVARARNGDSYL